MKRMTNLLILIMVTVLTGAIAGGLAMAGNAYGPGSCIAPGSIPCVSSEPVAIYGVVKNISAGSPGMVIDNGSEDVTVYGIGPIWYWRSIGTARPAVGQDIKINVYKITFHNGTTRLIARSIDLNSRAIKLRDTRTGMPLWWKMRCRGKRGPAQRCRKAWNCLQ